MSNTAIGQQPSIVVRKTAVGRHAPVGVGVTGYRELTYYHSTRSTYIKTLMTSRFQR